MDRRSATPQNPELQRAKREHDGHGYPPPSERPDPRQRGDGNPTGCESSTGRNAAGPSANGLSEAFRVHLK